MLIRALAPGPGRVLSCKEFQTGPGVGIQVGIQVGSSSQRSQMYLSNRALNGLKAYRYKPAGYTQLDVLHTPLWDWVTNRLPLWLAPNLITLTGLLWVIASFIVKSYYLMNYTGEAPRWVYALSAISVIIYVNLDCIDGKQARRTKSSSPLGQLFDHGCDALSIRLLLDNTHCSMSHPCGWTAAVIINSVMLPWILSHWEEYHTGSLIYGTAGFGVLEANYTLAILHTLVAIYGTAFWSIRLNNLLPFLLNLGIKLTMKDLWFIAFVVGSLVQVAGQIVRICSFKSSDLPADERGHKELGVSSRLWHFTLVIALLVLGTWWTSYEGAMAYGQCRLVSITYGLAYTLVASQLIVAHMAKEPFRPSTWAYLLILAGIANNYLKLVDGLTAASFLCSTTLLWYGHYAMSVVSILCDHLGIKAFRIKIHSS